MKLLHKVENTLTKPQQTLEFENIKPIQNFSSDKTFAFPGKWIDCVTDTQVYNTVYKSEGYG